jgi:hypothetical protein
MTTQIEKGCDQPIALDIFRGIICNHNYMLIRKEALNETLVDIYGFYSSTADTGLRSAVGADLSS